MPLNMNTVGTGAGIGGGSGNGESVYGSPTIAMVDNSSKIKMNSMKIYDSIKHNYGRIYAFAHDDKYLYSINEQSMNRRQMIVNTNNTYDENGDVQTQLFGSSNYYYSNTAMIEHYIYFTEHHYGNSRTSPYAYFYRYDIKSGAKTQLLSDTFASIMNISNGAYLDLFAYTNVPIDGNKYFLFITKTDTYSSNLDYRCLLIKDNPSTGCSVVTYSQYSSTVSLGVTYPSSYSTTDSGLKRIYGNNNQNMGIVSVVDDNEFYNIDFANLYMFNSNYINGTLAYGTTFAMTRDNWRIQIGKTTHTVSITQVSSTKIDTIKSANAIIRQDVTYPKGTTMYITAGWEYENVNTSIYYGGYFRDVYTYYEGKDSYTLTKLDNLDIGDIADSRGKFESESFFDLIYYPCQYRDIFIIEYGNDEYYSYIYPVDIEKTALDTDGAYTKVSWMFNKGDTVICDSGIISYTYNGTTTSVNTTSYRITSAGTYEFKLKLKTAGEQSSFIIQTSGGAIVCPGIKFVDDTHISGYFIKGLKINGTKITTTGYQTVTGTFNGRVTISK